MPSGGGFWYLLVAGILAAVLFSVMTRGYKGEKFEYSSFAPLQTQWGTMEGSYMMQREDGSTFDVHVRRFYLVGPHQ